MSYHWLGIEKVVVRLKDGQLESRVGLKDGLYKISPVRKTRSNAQNKLLHGLLFPESAKAIAEKTGRKITPDFAKALLKTKFAIGHDDELGEYIIPTSKMNTAQLSKFVEDCVRYIAVYCGVSIELPGDWQGIIGKDEK